jgi:hypothetical protein
VILAWVVSLLLLCSTIITYLERLSSLRIIEVNTMQQAKQHFMTAEKAVLECEQNITNLTNLEQNNCFIQFVGKNRWLISSKEKPAIQIGVVIDEKTGIARRINWRQVFE